MPLHVRVPHFRATVVDSQPEAGASCSGVFAGVVNPPLENELELIVSPPGVAAS